MISSSAISCGVHQLYGMDNRIYSYTTCTEFLSDSFEAEDLDFDRFMIFSDIVSKKHEQEQKVTGTKLAKFITQHNLGKITASDKAKNPNSGNMIRVWIWEINTENLRKFLPVEEEEY